MILFFYNLALLTALAAGSPWWLWRMATTEKYREGLMAAAGQSSRVAEERGPRERPVIWLHAVSVGEVLAREPAGWRVGPHLPGVSSC